MSLGAWSLSGRLREGRRQEEIIRDARDYKVEVAALQAAMWSADAVAKGDRGEEVVNSQSPAQGRRGLGLYMTTEWRERLVAAKVVSEREAVVKLRVRRESEGEADVATAHSIVGGAAVF